MLFNRRKKEVKEYMKYEDGKIISIEVEQKPKYKPLEDFSVDYSSQKTFLEATKEKTKSWFTLDRLKKILYIIVFLMFIYSLYDVYKAFFLTDPSSENPNKKHVIENQLPPQQNENPVSPSGNNGTNNSEEKPDNNYFSTEPITNQNPLNNLQSHDEFKNLLSYANQVNIEIVTISKNEITYIEDYLNQKANYIGLKSKLNKSLNQKTTLYQDFQSYKEVYDKNNMSSLYEETEKRIEESMAFTNQATALLDTVLTANEFTTLINDYIEKDETIRKIQAEKLIEILKARNIPYTIDEENNQIRYSIQ